MRCAIPKHTNGNPCVTATRNSHDESMSAYSHSAPGAAAGFAYQFERTLYWLASSPAGTVVGIETTDDVVVRLKNGQLLTEQDKHSIQEDGAPFGDRSRDLWNTLRIWLDAIERGEISVDSTHFLLVTNKTLPNGIARQISDAKDDAGATTCIHSLAKAAENPPDQVADLMERVLRDSSRAHLAELLIRVKLIDGVGPSGGEALRSETIARLPLPGWALASANSVLDELRGWLDDVVMNLWRHGHPGWVQRDHFINCLHSVLDRRKREISRERAAHLIPLTDDVLDTERGRPFVRQLHLVTEDNATVDASIREFIRCNIEKLRLSREGNVTDGDWLAFEDTLVSRWKKIRTRVVRMSKGKPEAEIGYEIFADTTENHRERLAGSETEQVYLTAGSYHRLADLLSVGWHPRYEDLMKAGKK